MKTLFKSQGLWDLVESRFIDIEEPNATEEERLRETKKKDAKALFFIQQAIHEMIFSKIAVATEAWQILKKEFQGSSKAHESRINKSLEKNEERAFQMKEESPIQNEKSPEQGTQGRGRGAFRGKGRGKGRGQYGWTNSRRSGMQCHHCHRFGHIEANCWYKNNQASYVEEEEEDNMLFIAHSTIVDHEIGVWFVDSGCSNHMSREKSAFKKLDETKKKKGRIWLGDNKEIQVEGKGTIAVHTSHEHGIHKELTASYTPEQNGVAER
ncbi:Retrovirus-related Pol polyprotein from transposon TNT 1-94 [Quillaja saponaria]|uniref:Retrovirus-related Pol polyprotein from transposon TNT 1-94 n=1 Tax=Quillaja saponaria TaxID=32244 RepID=A0AAD7L233_QUISA|nr:Retrovirus-related Pol polyprotein from transposon TNT 1-94 [Quillaja saponaria]